MRLCLNRRIVYTDLEVLLSDLTTTVFDVLRIYRHILPILRLYFQMFQKSLSDSPILPILRFYLKALKTFKMNLTTTVFDVLRITVLFFLFQDCTFRYFRNLCPILRFFRFYDCTLRFSRIHSPILRFFRFYLKILQNSLSDSSDSTIVP